MAELNNYKECREYLDGGKNRKNTMDRPIANNTRIIQIDDGTIGIKLHDTFVVKYHENSHLDCINCGDLIQLDTGGWKTVTTRDRMNRFCPLNVWTERGVMYISAFNWHEIHNNKNQGIESKVYHFQDRMFFKPNDGEFYIKKEGQLVKLKPYSKKDEQKKRKQLNQIDTFIRNYLNKLTSGKMDTPGNGDCLYCQFELNPDHGIELGTLTKDGYQPGVFDNSSHLISHMKEKYYVPSIVWNAIRSECYDPDGMFGNPNMTGGLSQFDKHNISCWFHPESEHKPYADDMTVRRVKKIMKQYFIKRLGI